MLRLFKKAANNLEEFDLLEGSLNIPLTQAQTDPTNPTKITTEYSKSVKLPLTPKNLQIMGYYTELDSVITQIDAVRTFKPTIAMPVVVVNDNDIIFEGKLKLDKVNDYKGNRNMECTLYGKMNDYFNLMLNTSYWWDSINQAGQNVNSAGMYVLPNILDEGYNICKETVLHSWKTLPYGYTPATGYHAATLNPTRYEGDPNNWNPATSQSHSIIAWAPTEQGQYANFEKDKVIIGTWEKLGSSVHKEICYGGTQNGTLVDIVGLEDEPCYIDVEEEKKPVAEVVAEGGFSERQLCQYRSYYQKPTVYVNQLWKQYQELSQSITGIPLELDEDWFNDTNNRYTDLIYTLPDLQQEKKTETGSGSVYDSITWSAPTIDCHEYAFGTNGGGSSVLNLTGGGTYNGHIRIPSNNTGYCNFSINLAIWIRRRGGLSNSSEYALCNGDGTASCIDLQVAFRNINDNTEVHTYNFKIVDEDNTSWSSSGVDELIRMGTKSWNPDPQTINFNLEGTVLIGQNNTSDNKEYEMIVSVYCYNGNIDGGPGKALFQTRGRIQNDTALCASCGDNPTFTFNKTTMSVTISEEYRSHFRLAMKDLFPANYSPFNILLQYTKLFNLVWHYDQLRNKVTVMTREKWFNMYANDILDWTDKVDKSREFSFKPLAWDKKYITFNYDDFEMDWLKDFKERYNITYGTKRITTQYNFNTDTEELMCTNDSDKINPSIQVSMSRFPMSATKSEAPSPLAYHETFIANRKDNKSANVWGQFFFRNGNKNWDADNGKNSVWVDTTYTPSFVNFGINIVDDTEFQVRRKIFAPDMTIYASSSDRKVQVPNACRPIFSVFDRTGNYSCQFSKPAMTFYDNEASEMQKTINVLWWTQNLGPVETFAQDVYTDRWSKIIEEQYNEQNKLITCYVKLNDIDYRTLTCNRFVQIGNVLYTIYKVNDFQLGTGGLTKVTLLQVWNLSKYLGQYYVEPEPEPEPTEQVPSLDIPFYFQNDTSQMQTIVLKHSGINPTISVSDDNLLWRNVTVTSGDVTIGTINVGQKLYVKASTPGNYWNYSYYHDNSYARFSGYTKIGGNIMSLYYGTNFTGTETRFTNAGTSSTAYTNVVPIFNEATNVEMLNLPATMLPINAYEYLFAHSTIKRGPNFGVVTSMDRRSCLRMFENCSMLQYIYWPGSAVVNSTTGYYWVNGVSENGTFQILNSSQLSWSRDVSGIPQGWMVLSGD